LRLGQAWRVDVQRQNGTAYLAPSLRSRRDRIGQKPGGNAAPTFENYDMKGVFHWAEHKQKRLHFG